MRKAILALSLTFILLVGGRSGQQAPQKADLGQITLSVRSVLTAKCRVSGVYDEPAIKPEGEIREEVDLEDRITYSFTGTQTLAVQDIADHEIVFENSPAGADYSLTITGGGRHSALKTADGKLVHRIDGTWSYQALPLPEEVDYFYLHEALLGGRYKVVFPNPLIENPKVTSSGTVESQFEKSSYTTIGVAPSAAAARLMNRALKDPGFLKKFEGAVPNDASGFQTDGKAEFSASGTEEDRDRPGISTAWSGSWTVEYTLGLSASPDTEAVIETPAGYDGWLPNAAETEDAPGPQPFSVKVRVHKKGDPKAPAPKKARFKFELVDTTGEKGVCLNWPADKAQETYDLRIERGKNKDLDFTDDEKNEGQKAQTREKDLTDTMVTISCFDWGAYARLKVTAVLDDAKGTKIPAHLDSDRSKYELPIPKDENGNKIADSWEIANGVSGQPEDDDSESDPAGDGHPGDGLTLFEEYRGFMENGKHISGDPKKKDLFICNELGPMANLGIGMLENISGLAVHSRLKPKGKSAPGELDASRVINLNHTKMPHVVNQHGVIIVKGDEGLTSEAEGTEGYENINGPPKTCKKIKIGRGLLGKKYSAYERASIVAHELLHGCSVWHHGGGDQGLRKFQTKTDADGAKRIYVFTVDAAGNAVEPGAAIVLYQEPNTIVNPDQPLLLAGFKLWVGVKQGLHSGDTGCVMRYDCARVFISGAGRFVYYPVDEETGLGICTNAQGTGVNEAGRKPEPRYGDATAGKGNCAKQICVNDKDH
jgi:hypothetical protein